MIDETRKSFYPAFFSNCASHNHQPYRRKASACPVLWYYPSSIGFLSEKKNTHTHTEKEQAKEYKWLRIRLHTGRNRENTEYQ